MRHGIRWTKLLWTVVVAVLVVVWLYPIILSVFTSLKSTEQISRNPLAFPHPFDWKVYAEAWNVVGFPTLLMNSALYAFFGSLLALALGILPAYAFTRFRVPGGMIMFVLILTTLMLPQQTVIIPLYNLMVKIGLLNTRVGLIIIHGVYGMAFEMLILSGFVSTIPKEVELAARVDGCTDFGVLRWIIVPLAIPAAAVGFTINFIDIWKEFFFALMFINSRSQFPVTLGVLIVRYNRYFSATNLPAAVVVISQLPVIVVFIFAYRWISSGIFVGSVKG